jgi:hypothetical protein
LVLLLSPPLVPRCVGEPFGSEKNVLSLGAALLLARRRRAAVGEPVLPLSCFQTAAAGAAPLVPFNRLRALPPQHRPHSRQYANR